MKRYIPIYLIIICILLGSGFLMSQKQQGEIIDQMPATTKKVLLVPLDSRPPCGQLVADNGRTAGVEIILPPSETMDFYTLPGDTSKMRKWLYDEIKDCVKQVGIEHLSDIKELCNDGVSYDDIKMVIADLKHRNIIEHDDETSKTDSEWHFIKEVSFIKSSKYFLSYQCRVVLSELGYYLEINDGYIKLGDYPKGFSHDDGNIWIKKPIIDKGYRMVHDIQVNSHLIGYIREETNKIVYTNPENEEYTINFT